jgi:flagellar L-ring protein precursor FlgH
MKTVLLFSLFFLVSCAGYVNQLHRQIDSEEKVGKAKPQDPRDRYAAYREPDRFHQEDDKRPIKNPVTYSLGSDPSSQQMRPPVKREYRPQRYNAKDFVDDDSSGSLWANQGSSSSLFTYQNDKHTGDMVIINVLENLRNQISAELKRTFPDKPKRAGKDGAADDKKAAAAATAAGPAAAADNEMDMKVYDKISGTVMEEISKDYILLRGRKEVIFKKEKRSIEVQALVSRKDIMENDYVNSDKLLESRVFILRDNQ